MSILKVLVMDLTAIVVCGAFYCIGYLQGQLNPKYSIEDQLRIREVEQKLESGYYDRLLHKDGKKTEKRENKKQKETETNEIGVEVNWDMGLALKVYDVGIIAETIWREARGESSKGREAVASVIVNRMKERKLTGSGVCLQHKQFSCWNGVDASGKPWTGKRLTASEIAVWQECVKLAGMIHRGEFTPKGEWNHYYNPYKCNPTWGKKMTKVEVIGLHKFGRV